MNNLKSKIEKVLAIEMLEYHDKNYLAFDNKRNSEEKQELLRECVSELNKEAVSKEE